METTATAIKSIPTPRDLRPHLLVAEIENDWGYRWWTEPMLASDLKAYLGQEHIAEKYFLSDVDCSTECWCGAHSK